MLSKAFIIAGPTGVGKTDLSIKLAKILKAEIISADSMQVYKGMDIGTAKITFEERQGIIHHMIDIVTPDQVYSVGDYEKTVNKILKDKSKNYIIVGGTGLYISSITDGFSKLPSRDDNIREKLEKLTLEELKNKLKEIDEYTYNNIDIENRTRLIRALEVCIITGNSFQNIKTYNIKNNDYEFIKIFLTRDREELYSIINKRVDKMLEKGLLDEAFEIYKNYPNNKAIGYKELFKYFSGELNLTDAVNLLKQKSRNYAKRQMTWFSNKKDYNVYNLSNMSIEDVLNDILKK